MYGLKYYVYTTLVYLILHMIYVKVLIYANVTSRIIGRSIKVLNESVCLPQGLFGQLSFIDATLCAVPCNTTLANECIVELQNQLPTGDVDHICRYNMVNLSIVAIFFILRLHRL